MLRILNVLMVIFMAGVFSLAQNVPGSPANWRLNAQGKLQYSLNESTWENAEYAVDTRLNDLYFVNGKDGWAVGKNATLLHWDGEKWSEVLIFSTADLVSVFFQDAENGWTVGTNGTVLRWNGTSWNVEESPTSESLVKVKQSKAGNLHLTAYSGATFERINGQWQVQKASVSSGLSASLSQPE